MRLLLVVVLCVVGCHKSAGNPLPSDPVARACVTRHGAWSPDGGLEPTVESQVATCLGADGGNCRGTFISQPAAICIAQAQGMRGVIQCVDTTPWYSSLDGRMVWSARNATPQLCHAAAGDVWVIDAVTGEVIAKTCWGPS